MASYDEFDTTRFASGGERPPITGGQWMGARIASVFDVPAHLVGTPGPEEDAEMIARRELREKGYFTFATDPAAPDWPDPTGGISAGSFIRRMVDEIGPGLPVGGLWDHDADNFLITNPDTKENTMQSKIKITTIFAGGGIATRGGPRAEVEIETSFEDTDKIESLVNAAQFSGCDLLRAMGIKPYEPPMEIAVAEPRVDLPTREFEDGDGQRADDDDEEGGEPERETPEAEWLATRQAAYKRMHDAIGSEAPNIIDVAKELAQGAEGEEGSEAFRERLGVLAKALSASADGLTNARLPF